VAGAKLERNVNPITCCYCLMLWLVPWKQFLVDGSGDVSKHASPNHSRASLSLIVEPGLYMLLRFSESGCARRLWERKPSLFNAFEILDPTSTENGRSFLVITRCSALLIPSRHEASVPVVPPWRITLMSLNTAAIAAPTAPKYCVQVCTSAPCV
jgi:hypothetical protein